MTTEPTSNQDNLTQNRINDFAYFKNDNLTEITIPEGITHIGKRAFSKCHNLKKIILPQTLTAIEESAFSDCENIEEIVIPPNVKSIGHRAFAGCSRLKRISLPEGLEKLSFAVFADCHNLREITLPNSIKELHSQTFLNCRRLTKVTLPDAITYLPSEFFKGCHNLDITLSPNIKTLGASVFENCYKLSTFPQNITSFQEDCFKNCRSLTNITLNSEITELPDGAFHGCTNLSNITYQGNNDLPIGKRCFKKCHSLTSVPSFVKEYNDQAFESCTGLTSIDITTKTIPYACFRNCKNLKNINGQEKINNMQSYAFSGCENLKSFDLSNLAIIPAEALSNCKNLQTVFFSRFTNTIGSRAFYNCPSLDAVDLPDSILKIGKQAFKFCHALKTITIPARLNYFGAEAFSYMDSLEQIYVSPFNQTFETEDHKAVFNKQQQSLVLYASGCKDESYSLEEYNVKEDEEGHSLINPTNYIAEYAFAGAKHLRELTICACTNNIEITAFEGCSNLKKLIIASISLFTCPTLHLKDHGRYYFPDMSKHPAFIPFETIEFTGDIVQIYPKCIASFNKIKKIILPSDYSYSIGNEAFRECSLLQTIDIPANVYNIGQYAIPSTTEIRFENGLRFKGFIELEHGNQYMSDYKLYTLESGKYYIEQNGKTTAITKKQISAACSHPEYIEDKPILYIDFMNDLIKHNLGIRELFNGILLSTMSLENRKVLFTHLKKEDTFLLNALENSGLLDEKDILTEYLFAKTNFTHVINHFELLRKYNITTPELANKFLIALYDPFTVEQLINQDLPTLERVLKLSNLFAPDKNTQNVNKEDKKQTHLLTYKILESNSLMNFIELVKKYNIQDRYLFNKVFIAISDSPLLEDLFKVYDSNIKRLLKASLADESNASAIQNVLDLLSLMKISGALETDPITRQKACTFITEKIFPETLPNNTPNECCIVGDDLHRVFNLPYIREEFDAEFASFFLENYTQLYAIEKEKSGFIVRVYLNFREISRTSTSNKGSQRKLKVTIEKCVGYLSNVKFDGVTEKTKDLANIIGAWYNDNATWTNALKVYYESLRAPRNIFTSLIYDKNQNSHFDNASCNDLREPISPNFSYEWLPKQEYENLILGKFCSCCAHIEGAGAGIMRASMILDCVQNLVIRNETGKIIAKSTIYVNRKERYGVFNNVEISLNHRDSQEIKKIYNAFMRGAIAFWEAYNKNNPDTPLDNISIGATRNKLATFLTDDMHPIVEVQPALNYGDYSGRPGGWYNGDWKNTQRLVLKR